MSVEKCATCAGPVLASPGWSRDGHGAVVHTCLHCGREPGAAVVVARPSAQALRSENVGRGAQEGLARRRNRQMGEQSA